MTETEAAILKKWEDTYQEEYCIGSEEAEGEFWEAEWKEMMKRDLSKLKAADRKPPVRALRDNRRMATLGLIEYADASSEVRAVYDDIMAVRNTDWINNFWKALAHDPATLRRTWESIKQIMAPGALDALTKEMMYVAVSASNQCPYCIASHTAAARKAGMNDQMFAELMAIVGMANETNRLASGYQVEIDQRFKS
jgi:AhpD family alkylhydroperoxidase